MKYQIVTTEADEFLLDDASKIFLKKSLKDYFIIKKKKNFLEEYVPNYDPDSATIKKKIDFLREKKKKYTNELTIIFNDLGIINEDKAYCEILLSSWLVHVISSIKIRHDELVNLKNKFNEKKLYITKINKNFTFKDTKSLISSFTYDNEFNQFLYANIAEEIGINTELFENKEIRKEDRNQKNISFIKDIKFYFFSVFLKIFKPSLLIDSYLKKSFSFLIKSKGSLVIMPSTIIDIDLSSKIDLNIRNKIKIEEDDVIDKIFNKLLKFLIPTSLIEESSKIKKKISLIKSNISILGTSVGIHTSEAYKFLLAEVKKKKIKTLGFQHGAYYNCQTDNIIEEVEKNSCSTYLYWNNKLGLGLNHLHSLKKLSLKNISKNKKIIFYQSLLKKYNNRIEYQMNINDNLSIINGYLYFYENLEQNLKDFFYIKNYPTNNFWNSKIFFNQKFGQKVNFINQENIKKITSESKVFITDKISTPFIEMIYMNIPTLVYTNIEEYSYTENINYLFKKLKEINLIHDDAKSCVNFLNKNYTSIDNWWEMVLKNEHFIELKKQLFNDNPNYSDDFLKFLIKNSNN